MQFITEHGFNLEKGRMLASAKRHETKTVFPAADAGHAAVAAAGGARPRGGEAAGRGRTTATRTASSRATPSRSHPTPAANRRSWCLPPSTGIPSSASRASTTTEGYSDPNVVVRKVTLPGHCDLHRRRRVLRQRRLVSAKTHSALREIVLPQSLKTIGERAFYHNYYLEKITHSCERDGDRQRLRLQRATNLSDITIQGEHTLLHGGAFGARTSYSVGTFAGQLSALYNDWLYDDSASDFFIWQGQLLGL